MARAGSQGGMGGLRGGVWSLRSGATAPSQDDPTAFPRPHPCKEEHGWGATPTACCPVRPQQETIPVFPVPSSLYIHPSLRASRTCRHTQTHSRLCARDVRGAAGVLRILANHSSATAYKIKHTSAKKIKRSEGPRPPPAERHIYLRHTSRQSPLSAPSPSLPVCCPRCCVWPC